MIMPTMQTAFGHYHITLQECYFECNLIDNYFPYIWKLTLEQHFVNGDRTMLHVSQSSETK